MIDTQTIRNKILDLAMRGKLTEQLPEDGTAEELYQQIQKEKQALIKTGRRKQRKLQPEITDNELPFDIPSNWKWIHLGELISIESGRGLIAAEMKSGRIPVYGGNGITGYHDCGFVPEGTVIIGRVGYYCGSVHVTEQEAWVTDNAFITTYPEKRIDKWFLVYVLRHMKLGQSNNGSAQPVVSGKKIYPLAFPLPPLAEQYRIVERIEAAFSALDTIEALQSKYADNLTVLKSKLIDAAIQGKLTEQLPEDGTAEELLKHLREQKKNIEDSGVLKGRKKKAILPMDDTDFPFPIPATWKWIRLDSIAEIFGRIGFRGYTKNDIVEQGKGAISLSPSNITIDGKCVYDKCTYITWEKYEESPEIMVAEEDLIIVKTGSSYGKCCVVKALPEKATINPQLALLKYILCNRYYLHIVLNSTMAHKQYEDFVVGAATPTFSQEDLSNFILPLPPLAEQERIVNRINELLALCGE